MFVLADGMPWRLAETPIAVVIHGRSKERSDARRPEDPFRDFRAILRCRILLRCVLRSRSRHGFQGLRDAASRLLRPGMTRLGASTNPRRLRWFHGKERWKFRQVATFQNPCTEPLGTLSGARRWSHPTAPAFLKRLAAPDSLGNDQAPNRLGSARSRCWTTLAAPVAN